MANTFVTPMYASRSSTVDHAAAASDGPGGSTDSVDSPKIPTGHATAPTCGDDDFGKSNARKTGGNTLNPVSEWIWSPEPVHEALVNLDTYIQAQQISAHRFGSRSAPGANLKHPDTKRSYLLRTYLFCQLCGRRMFGKTRHNLPYYVCAPKKGYLPEGHPAAGTFFVREDTLLARLTAFFSDHVFGAYRRSLLQASLRTLDLTAQQEREQQAAALRRSITDTETRSKKLSATSNSSQTPTQTSSATSTNAAPNSAPKNSTTRPNSPTSKRASCTPPTPT
jgi:hypothetical protein